jgi:hypothetical protein
VAQEYFVEYGVMFAVNVKPVVMERLARASNCLILTSATDQLLNPMLILGTCEQFYLQTYLVPRPTTAADSNNVIASNNSNNSAKSANEVQAMMVFDGCPTEKGATIILRGHPSKEILKKLKKCLLVLSTLLTID